MHCSLFTLCEYYISSKAIGIENGSSIAGEYRCGNDLHSFSNSWSFCIDHNKAIYIADSSNARIVEWKRRARKGHVVAGGNGRSHRTNQFSDPRVVLIDKKNKCLIICDQRTGADKTTNRLIFIFILNPIELYLIRKNMSKFMFEYEFYVILIEFLCVNFTNKTFYFSSLMYWSCTSMWAHFSNNYM